MNDGFDWTGSERFKGTIFHELGHGLVAASFGYSSYLDVIHRPGAALGVCVSPGMQSAPLVPSVLKRLGGGMGEYLTLGHEVSAQSLYDWLRHPDRQSEGMRTDIQHLHDDIKTELGLAPDLRDGGDKALGQRVDDYIRFAAHYAELVLYKEPWLSRFNGAERQLSETGAILITPKGLSVQFTTNLGDSKVA